MYNLLPAIWAYISTKFLLTLFSRSVTAYVLCFLEPEIRDFTILFGCVCSNECRSYWRVDNDVSEISRIWRTEFQTSLLFFNFNFFIYPCLLCAAYLARSTGVGSGWISDRRSGDYDSEEENVKICVEWDANNLWRHTWALTFSFIWVWI